MTHDDDDIYYRVWAGDDPKNPDVVDRWLEGPDDPA